MQSPRSLAMKKSRGAHVPSRQRYLGNLDDEVMVLLPGVALDSDLMAHFQRASRIGRLGSRGPSPGALMPRLLQKGPPSQCL